MTATRPEVYALIGPAFGNSPNDLTETARGRASSCTGAAQSSTSCCRSAEPETTRKSFPCTSLPSLELPAGSVSRGFEKGRGFRTLVAPWVAVLQVTCRERLPGPAPGGQRSALIGGLRASVAADAFTSGIALALWTSGIFEHTGWFKKEFAARPRRTEDSRVARASLWAARMSLWALRPRSSSYWWWSCPQ